MRAAGIDKRADMRRMPAGLWSHQETSQFLGITEAALHTLNYKGSGPKSYKVGKRRRYDPTDIREWLESRASNRTAS